MFEERSFFGVIKVTFWNEGMGFCIAKKLYYTISSAIYQESLHFIYFSATPSACDLIYNESCYRLYEVSDGINWLDAQSSCAVLGGDLTSITERENNYLYTIIPDAVSNCWIGLNDRDTNNGSYTWIDNSTSNFTNWAGSTPSAGDEDCVDITRSGAGNWETVDCETTTINAFLCKRSSDVTTDTSFGVLINEGLDFQSMSGNRFLYESLTLACGGDEDDTNSCTIGLFNQTTTIAIPGTTYTYTSSNSTEQPSNQWTCDSNGIAIQLNTVNIYTPMITVSTSISYQQHTTLYPGVNNISLQISVRNFSISTNLQGRWILPNNTNSSSQTISYGTLDYEYFGLYQFYTMTWDGIEVLAIQADLIRNGYFVTSTVSTSSTAIQNDSTIVLKEATTMIECSISNLGDSIQWYYKATKDDMEMNRNSSSTFSIETGISSLTVNSMKPVTIAV
ncbi:C-type mannose receptor 2 [Oopsacas minuta]|uniref:C-type mannose receptor 2 n=1 Tax=Oopsacas minuta TaxID=111878 RepID=A0AAV7KIT7_9METZ|nr:C-type mannose receptor 2 [Oopsacas minuta]